MQENWFKKHMRIIEKKHAFIIYKFGIFAIRFDNVGKID